MDGVPTVVDAWRDELEGGPVVPFFELASAHPSGLRVLPLSSSPIQTEILDPDRVAKAIAAARRSVDFVIVDLHPSYSPLNRAVFDKADRILVPVTPDLPAIRAVMKLRDVADELGMRDRLSLIVNRFNSGVPVADIEKSVGIPAYAQIRSAGLAASSRRPTRAARSSSSRPGTRSPATSRSSRTGCSASTARAARQGRLQARSGATMAAAGLTPASPSTRRARARPPGRARSDCPG